MNIIDRSNFIRDLIGKPWKANGTGPNEFDCWHLAQHVENILFKRKLPSIDVPDNLSWAWLLHTISTHSERANWVERLISHGLVTANDGALVLMARSLRPAHIGVWLVPEQGVIHCDQGTGVMFDSISFLRAQGWNKLTFLESK